LNYEQANLFYIHDFAYWIILISGNNAFLLSLAMDSCFDCNAQRGAAAFCFIHVHACFNEPVSINQLTKKD